MPIALWATVHFAIVYAYSHQIKPTVRNYLVATYFAHCITVGIATIITVIVAITAELRFLVIILIIIEFIELIVLFRVGIHCIGGLFISVTRDKPRILIQFYSAMKNKNVAIILYPVIYNNEALVCIR